MELSPSLVRSLAVVVAGTFAWMLYFDLKDRQRPEPRRALALALGLGVAAAALAHGLFRLAEALGAPDLPWRPWWAVLAYCLLLVGPIEEGSKFLAARLGPLRSAHFDEPLDGLVYAGAVAIGFAAAENVLYMGWTEGPVWLARAVASPLTHALFSAVWGLGAARGLLGERRPGRRLAWQVGSVALAAVLHGLYDFVLVAWEAAFLAAGIVLVLWSFVIYRAHKLKLSRLRNDSAPLPGPAGPPRASLSPR